MHTNNYSANMQNLIYYVQNTATMDTNTHVRLNARSLESNQSSAHLLELLFL